MCKMLSLKIQKLFDSFSNSGRKITGKNISLKTKFNYKVIKLLYSWWFNCLKEVTAEQKIILQLNFLNIFKGAC